MAESKTYKGRRGGYYPETPAKHEADFQYYIGPFDTTQGHDLQNKPGGGNKGQFGRPENEEPKS